MSQKSTKHTTTHYQLANAANTVYKLYARTRYGRHLLHVARYERFRPHHYSVQYWERLLGSDVNNLHHMQHSISVTRWFVTHENKIQSGRFSLHESMLLSVTAAMHDQAEAIIGDIPHGKKSKRERQREVYVLREYESRFEPGLRGKKLSAYRTGRNRIAFSNSDQKLAGAFEAIELIGFVQNALAAQRRITQLQSLSLSDPLLNKLGIHTTADQREIIVALRRLSIEVLGSGVLGRLLDITHHYPSVQAFLYDHKYEIDQGLSNVSRNNFNWYDSGTDPFAKADESERRYLSFLAQRNRWHEWRTSN